MDTQISAVVSASTRDLLDQHSRRTGIKKSRLIKDAIRHHLAALAAFPEEFVVPTRLVVSKADFSRMTAAPKTVRPKAALRALMAGR